MRAPKVECADNEKDDDNDGADNRTGTGFFCWRPATVFGSGVARKEMVLGVERGLAVRRHDISIAAARQARARGKGTTPTPLGRGSDRSAELIYRISLCRALPNA